MSKGRNIDAAVGQGEELLKSIKEYDITQREVNAEDQLEKATKLFQNVSDFKLPGDDLTRKTDLVEESLKNFTAKLDDLYNNTQYSLNKATEAEGLLRKTG